MKSAACARDWFNIKFRFRRQIIFYHIKFDVTSVLLLSRRGNSYAQFSQRTNGRPNVQCPRGFNHISELDELECSHYLKQVLFYWLGVRSGNPKRVNNFQFSVLT